MVLKTFYRQRVPFEGLKNESVALELGVHTVHWFADSGVKAVTVTFFYLGIIIIRYG